MDEMDKNVTDVEENMINERIDNGNLVINNKDIEVDDDNDNDNDEDEDEDEDDDDDDDIPLNWDLLSNKSIQQISTYFTNQIAVGGDIIDNDDEHDLFYQEWSDALNQNSMEQFLACRYNIHDYEIDKDIYDESMQKVDVEEKDATETTTLKSPSKTPKKDQYMESLDQFTGSNPGSVLIRGVTEVNNDGDDDDDDEDYTDDQLSKVRHIIITPSRKQALNRMEKFVNPSDGIFNTTTSNQIILGIPGEVNFAMNQQNNKKRFDHLFALTFALWKDETWLFDNEFWESNDLLDQSIKLLSKAWRFLLKTPSELGLDDEYSNPGVYSLLEQFETMVSHCQFVNAKFKWRHLKID